MKNLKYSLFILIVILMIGCKKIQNTNNSLDKDIISSLRNEVNPSDVYTHPYILKVFYLIPKDKSENKKYTTALVNTFKSIQNWYLSQLEKKSTFVMQEKANIVEVIKSQRTESWYFNKIETTGWSAFRQARDDLEAIIGEQPSNETWIIYVDVGVESLCEINQGGGGYKGLAVMQADDLNGLIQDIDNIKCHDPQDTSLNRWIGGGAHEAGHAFGLHHPEDDEADNYCNIDSCIMRYGWYADYPNTKLLESDKNILNSNPLFSSTPIINAVFDDMESTYNMNQEQTRKYNHNNESLFYRYYGNDTYLIYNDGRIQTIFNGVVEKRGSLADWFDKYVFSL